MMSTKQLLALAVLVLVTAVLCFLAGTFWAKNGAREASIMGPQSLLNHTDDAPMFGGAPEVRQRRNLAWTHPGGTPEIMRLIIARRLGISRTRERAAPTPSTATSHTG